MQAISLGEMGMNLEDFYSLTIAEWEQVYTRFSVKAHNKYADDWSRTRVQSLSTQLQGNKDYYKYLQELEIKPINLDANEIETPTAKPKESTKARFEMLTNKIKI